MVDRIPFMARPPRPEHERGALFHVMSRGVDGAPLFFSDADYALFMNMVARVQSELPFLIHFFCLMPNHFHILVELLDAAMSDFVKLLKASYATHFNRSFGRHGPLFDGRFPAFECADDDYYAELARYITRNPVKAGLAHSPEDWPWSSHRQLMNPRAGDLVARKRVLSRFGLSEPDATHAYHRHVSVAHPEQDALFAMRLFPLKEDRAIYAPWAQQDLTEILAGLCGDISRRYGEDLRSQKDRKTPTAVSMRREFAIRAKGLGFPLADAAAFLGCAASTLTRAVRENRTQGS